MAADVGRFVELDERCREMLNRVQELNRQANDAMHIARGQAAGAQ